MRLSAVLTILGFLLLLACQTVRATGYSTPKERVTECQEICTSVGLKFTALVVIANGAGCVCEPKSEATASTRRAGAGAAAGGAVIAAAAAAAAQSGQIHGQMSRQLQPHGMPFH